MNILDVQIAVVDTETTGLKVEDGAELVELACVITTSDHVTGMFATTVCPENEIPPQTSAIHGLVYDDVKTAPNARTAIDRYMRFLERGIPVAPTTVAHNAVFDKQFIPGSSWLCTRRIARHLWPDAPDHKNQTLRYWLNLQVDTLGILPHRALADALVTAALLRRELEALMDNQGFTTLEEVIAFEQASIVMERMPIGKHQGERIADLPRDYVAWLCRQPDLDEDLRWNLGRLVS